MPSAMTRTAIVPVAINLKAWCQCSREWKSGAKGQGRVTLAIRFVLALRYCLFPDSDAWLTTLPADALLEGGPTLMNAVALHLVVVVVGSFLDGMRASDDECEIRQITCYDDQAVRQGRSEQKTSVFDFSYRRKNVGATS